MCSTVKCTIQLAQYGADLPSMRCECVTLVWPIRSLVSIVSALRTICFEYDHALTFSFIDLNLLL